MEAVVPTTLQEALTALIEQKRLNGKVSAYKKLEGAFAKLEEYTKGQSVPFDDLSSAWAADFAGWLTSKKRLAENTRATYLRSIFTACRKAAKAGANVDLKLFPAEYRANAIPRIKEGASKIDPERDMWFAMKCRTVTSDEMEKILEKDYPGIETFRTDVSRIGETRQGKRLQVVELLKNVLFFCTSLQTCNKLKYAYHDKAYIYDYKAGDRREFSIVSSNDLKLFMYLNEMGPERILYYFPGEADCPKIRKGIKVRVIEGKCKGATAVVTRQSKDNPLEAEVIVDLPILKTTAKAHLPWRFLAVCND